MSFSPNYQKSKHVKPATVNQDLYSGLSYTTDVIQYSTEATKKFVVIQRNAIDGTVIDRESGML